MKRLYPSLKRATDVGVSVILLLLSSPFFVLVFLLLVIDFRGMPFFLQKRPGRYGKIFTIIKFKTMRDLTDAGGKPLEDARRLTPLGRVIRATSLDELPQFINVLKGEMSLIGPRPLLTEYLALYNDFQARRHEVAPGITGWAQVNGRNAIGWDERFALDVWYVDHCSFGLDCRILLLTMLKVARSEGIDSGSSVTMDKFSKSI